MEQPSNTLRRPPRSNRRSDASLIVEDMIEGARMMLSITAALLGSGRRVDLTGLDDEFGRLCAGTLALPLHEGRRLRPMLDALRMQLDQLHASLPPP